MARNALVLVTYEPRAETRDREHLFDATTVSGREKADVEPHERRRRNAQSNVTLNTLWMIEAECEAAQATNVMADQSHAIKFKMIQEIHQVCEQPITRVSPSWRISPACPCVSPGRSPGMRRQPRKDISPLR